MNTVRLWAYGEGNQPYSLQTRPGEFNEEGFRALDQAVAAAARRGIRVILVLGNYWVRSAHCHWLGISMDETLH